MAEAITRERRPSWLGALWLDLAPPRDTWHRDARPGTALQDLVSPPPYSRDGDVVVFGASAFQCGGATPIRCCTKKSNCFRKP